MHKRQKLVILPGWSHAGALMWHHQISQLEAQYDIEAIVITDKTTAEDTADAVLARAPGQFVLLGHSLGGYIAQQVAIKAPHRVRRLILVATHPGNSSEEQRDFFEQSMLQPLLAGVLPDWDALHASAVAPQYANDRGLLQNLAQCQGLSLEALTNQTKVLLSARDISPQLATLPIPTLIIYGRQDPIFSMATQLLMLDTLQNARLEVIEDCGHFPALERAEATSRRLRSWLQPFGAEETSALR